MFAVKPCSHCRQPRDASGRYCRRCRNAYMRRWRRDRGGHAALTVEERRRDTARSYANVYRRRGSLELAGICVKCGSAESVEMHHVDYDRPLHVVELCRVCHRVKHRQLLEGL